MVNTLRQPPVALTLSETGEAPSKIQVIRTGTFHHPNYGKFTITKDHLLSFKKNFDAKIRGVDIALDYAHDSHQIAAGWMKDLEVVEADGVVSLWAEMKWTPKGKQVVSDGEFRYVSGDFSMDYQDNETLKKHGPTLLGAGLTNRPVVKGQAPVVELSETTEKKGDEVNLEEALKKIEELKAQLAAKENAPNPAADELKAAQKQIQEQGAKLAEYAEKEKQAAEATKLAEKKAAFDLKLSEGKVCEAQREAFMADDMTKFISLAEPLKTTPVGHGAQGGGAGEKSAEDQVMELAEKKLADKTATSEREAVAMVLSENPELRKKYETQQA